MTPVLASPPALVSRPEAALRPLVTRALLLRLGLAVFLHFATTDYTFAPDQETYHLFSAALARYWTGEALVPFALRGGEATGYYYLVAAIYAVFGDFALIPKLLNAVVGAYAVRLVYDVSLRVTESGAVALRAARYTAYFPSLILWSVLNIRDGWVVALILFSCRQALALQERPSLRALGLLAAAVLALTQFRSYILFALTLPILVGFLARQRTRILRNAVVGMLVAGVVIYADAAAGRNRRMRFIDFEDLNSSRRWSAGAAESGFARDVDISSPGKALAFLPVGLAYFMLAPFPWTVANLRQGFTIPEMLFFYSLFPSIVAGVGILLRRHLGTSLMILLMAAGITFGYAVGQGNVGTIYRHRSQVLPFFLIFGAVGVEARRQRRASAAAAVVAPGQPRLST